MLTNKEIGFLRKKLQEIKSPLFIHDNDGDGLSSYLLLYRYKQEGKGVPLRTSHLLDSSFIPKINQYLFDAVFVLDISRVDQDFIDDVKVPVYWIDHHQPLERKKVKYYNPRKKDPHAYIPTTRMAFQISERKKEDLWIAMVGCLADFHIPNFKDKFIKAYPDLMDKDADISTALFKNKIGILVKLFFFILKGSSSEAKKSISALRKVKSPYEILNQSSPAGKFVYKKFAKVNREYEEVLADAKKQIKKNKPFIIYEYQDRKWSFTANLANELTAFNQDKVVIIARKHDGKIKASLRAKVGANILDPLKKALEGVEGRGGGHFNACGAVIAKDDWPRFLKEFERELKESKVIK